VVRQCPPLLSRSINVRSLLLGQWSVNVRSANFRAPLIMVFSVEQTAAKFSIMLLPLIMTCLHVMPSRVHSPFSIHQARSVLRSVWERTQSVQAHVCARSSASDAGDHRLRRPSRTKPSSDGDAVSSRYQGLQGIFYRSTVAYSQRIGNLTENT